MKGDLKKTKKNILRSHCLPPINKQTSSPIFLKNADRKVTINHYGNRPLDYKLPDGASGCKGTGGEREREKKGGGSEFKEHCAKLEAFMSSSD